MENNSGKRGTGNSEINSEGAFKKEQFESLVREIISELYSNARYWDFFRSFNEESVHDFIAEYASRKAWYLLNGERAAINKTKEGLRFREMAERCFWEIQQKKLFNLQAEWRAGIIELNGIETTRDFLCWEHAIAACPFLTPVKKQELEMYKSYLQSGQYREKSWLYGWQDYDAYKNNISDHDSIPSWYQFYDQKAGTGYLMLLPDKKGEQEMQYIRSLKEHGHDESCRHDSFGNPIPGDLPELSLNHQSLNFFIRTFEGKNMLRYFEAIEPTPQDSVAEAELQDALRILSKVKEPIKLPEADDWKQSVIEGARRYKTSQIIANLEGVYEEYLLRLENGIAPRELSDRFEYEEQLSMALTYKSDLQKGRKLSGE